MEKLIFDLVSGDKEDMETKETRCLLCGNLDYSEVNRFKFNRTLFKTVRCTHDQMMWLQPQPSSEFYRKLYSTEYFGNTEDSLREQLTDEVADDPERRRNDARIRLDEIEEFKTSGDFLEVGCAAGFVLQEAKKRGWSVVGIEASEHYKPELAKEDIDVQYGDLLTFDAEGRRFDVVALYSVFEHFTDPDAYLEKLKSLMKPDGLLVLRVPNTPQDGPQTSLLVHLFHFTPETLRTYFDTHGLKIEMLNADAGTYKSEKYGFETPNMNIISVLKL